MEKITPNPAETTEPKKKQAAVGCVTLIVVIVLLIIAFSSSNKENKPTQDNKTETSTQSVQAPKVAEPEKVFVLAKDIITAYKENEVAADSKYKGKLITVSGIITNISNGMLDNEMLINIGTGEQYSFDSVYCNARPSEKDKVIALKKGGKISVEGLGNSATIGYPSLSDCVIK